MMEVEAGVFGVPYVRNLPILDTFHEYTLLSFMVKALCLSFWLPDTYLRAVHFL